MVDTSLFKFAELPRFSGVRTFGRLPHITCFDELDKYQLVIVGLPFDTGATFRVGARFGPESVRSASALLRPYNPVLNTYTFDEVACVDFGDAPVMPGFVEDSLNSMTNFIYSVAKRGKLTLAIGGDHTIALAELRALAAIHGPLALVHFDAHADLWDECYGHPYCHATPFRRALEEGLILPRHSIQIGMRGSLYGLEDVNFPVENGFTVIPTHELLLQTPKNIGNKVREVVGNRKAFLSFDVDFFDPSFAPGTGTPEVGGPTSFQGLSYLRACQGLNWVGADVVEVLPAMDYGQITAHLAAQVGYEFISLVALSRRELKGIA
ncbi:MAG: agmatinase [Cyanobacteriota bacterium]